MKNILGVSNYKWNKAKNGEADIYDTNVFSRKLCMSAKEEKVYRHLLTVRSKFAENIPNHKNFDLPSNFTICEVLRMFHVRNPDVTVTPAYFVKIWQVVTVDSFARCCI
jgi:hypothetical protein